LTHLPQRTWPEGPVAVLGLGFGDEGKGAVVDAVARRRGAALVVRFNGGPQAAHHVVAPDGAVHCFAQFGAGTLAGARTFLSRFMLVEPRALAREADALARLGVAAPLRRVTVDRRCPVVTPFHRLIGRAEELSRGTARHGSCGMGVGAAWRDANNPEVPTIRFAALTGDRSALRRQLRQIQLIKLDRAEQLADARPDAPLAPLLAELARRDLVDATVDAWTAIAAELDADEGDAFHHVLKDSPGRVVFEGAHGALLDAELGFFPYCTPSRVAFAPAERLAAEVPGGLEPLRLGVLRAHATRHGPGPFVSEHPELVARLPEPHNPTGEWQGPMRVGWFDAVAGRLGLAIAGRVDGLVVTHLDRFAGWEQISACDAWLPAGAETPISQVAPLSGSLAERTSFSTWVAACRPVLQQLPGWAHAEAPQAAEFVAWIAARVAAPVVAWAAGPRSPDQRWTFSSADGPARPT
jgi:adenylosuccinate synthase